jgi:hypothetical protein
LPTVGDGTYSPWSEKPQIDRKADPWTTTRSSSAGVSVSSGRR